MITPKSCFLLHGVRKHDIAPAGRSVSFPFDGAGIQPSESYHRKLTGRRCGVASLKIPPLGVNKWRQVCNRLTPIMLHFLSLMLMPTTTDQFIEMQVCKKPAFSALKIFARMRGDAMAGRG